MTERTPEQITADNRLEDAIAEAVRAYDVVDEGDIVTTWMIAGASQGPDDGQTGYFHLYANGVQPTHIAIGLMRMTEHHLLNGDEDDD